MPGISDAAIDLALGLAGLRPGGHGLLVLTYHRVLSQSDPLMATEPDAVLFRRQAGFLARHCSVLPLGEAIVRLRASSLPRRAVSITFDDGYANNARVALPILREVGLSATFFVATGYLDGGCMWNDVVIEAVRGAPEPVLDLGSLGLGRYSLESLDARRRSLAQLLDRLRYLPGPERSGLSRQVAAQAGVDPPTDLMMTEAEVRHLHDSGMEIGGHTVSHPILAQLTAAEARREICDGRDRLAEITGVSPRSFAYPNGRPGRDFGPEHTAMVREAGFVAAVTTAPGTVQAEADPWLLPRVTLWSDTPARLTRNLLSIYLRG